MLKYNGADRNLRDTKFHNWRFDIFLKEELTREITPRECKRLSDGISYADYTLRVPSDEFVAWCQGMGSDVWISEAYMDGCAAYVDPKIVPVMILTWDFPKTSLQVNHAMYPEMNQEDF